MPPIIQSFGPQSVSVPGCDVWMHVLTSSDRFGVHLTGVRDARDGITALMHAALKGHAHVVELLIAGADLEAKDTKHG